MTPQQIVDGWDAGLRVLKAVHHQVGNHVISVDRDEAEVFCYGIDRFKFNLKFIDGNLDLEEAG